MLSSLIVIAIASTLVGDLAFGSTFLNDERIHITVDVIARNSGGGRPYVPALVSRKLSTRD